ncbi:MAG: class I SAM-dependent methyltransferase [Acidobacteria bacterium]|nr:MAG: class I SAM-dependent methyltransferase [Acidobacteriota bacterium]
MKIRSSLAKGRHLLGGLYRRYLKPASVVAAQDSAQALPGQTFKQERLRRIAPHLICSNCAGELNADKSICQRCRQTYRHTAHCFNFLTTEQQRACKIVPTENVAANDYDEIAAAIIAEQANGLILDCGAGCHNTDYANVINYEVASYPSTDVLGVGESLPFRAETFDAIFSLNVLEHVSDPFACAREITRVLKRGGTLYCVAPFLQPVHGYPNHFYNMTAQGLSQLFEKRVEIIEHKVPPSGVPIWAVNWILRSWADGLEGQTRADFLALRVGDLIADEPSGYLARDFVTQLSAEKNFELACTTMLLGRKI